MGMSVDELEQRLKQIQDPAKRLPVLDEIAAHYYDSDAYETAIPYYQQAEDLSPPGNLRAYHLGQRGICHFMLHQDKEAQEALSESKKAFVPGEEDLDPEIYGLVNYFLGSLSEYNEQNEASLNHRLEALKYLENLHREAQWLLLAGISRNYEQKGEFRQAVKFNTEAISLISDNDPEVTYIFESLGYNHYELGEYNEALEYFSRILKTAPNFQRKNDIYFNIGLCYQRLLNFRMALDSYLRILELKELNPSKESRSWLYIEIAHCYYFLKEHVKSLDFAKKALDLPIENKEEQAEVQSCLTNNYYVMGRFQEAVKAGEKTLGISAAFHNLEIMLPNLALSYYQLGESEKFRFYRDRCNRNYPDLSWTKQLNELEV